MHDTTTQGACGIQVTTVYPPQVFPGVPLSPSQQWRVSSQVGCSLVAWVGIQTQARGLVARYPNHSNHGLGTHYNERGRHGWCFYNLHLSIICFCLFTILAISLFYDVSYFVMLQV